MELLQPYAIPRVTHLFKGFRYRVVFAFMEDTMICNGEFYCFSPEGMLFNDCTVAGNTLVDYMSVVIIQQCNILTIVQI